MGTKTLAAGLGVDNGAYLSCVIRASPQGIVFALIVNSIRNSPIFLIENFSLCACC